MKVQLERKVSPCPDQLKCVACEQKFAVPDIRTLLCTDEGLIQGDLCPGCLDQREAGIRQKMREQSRRLMLQAERDSAKALSLRQQALELLSLSQETLAFPSFYQWLCKRFEVFVQEAQEIESARLGIGNSCDCKKRSHLRIVFEDKGELS